MKTIIFTDTLGIDSEYQPKPATSFVPEWYKKTESYYTGKKEAYIADGELATTQTIKRCLPVFDAITTGYIIPTPADVYVRKGEDGMPFYTWSNHGLISFHPVKQAPLHPARNDVPYAKWNNPWSIKTPSGYSCLFLSPLHQDISFEPMAGIVDTDMYHLPVNFPFVLKDKNFTGLIPAGTPMIQVIPFKRDAFKMSVEPYSDLVSQDVAKWTKKLHSTFFERYKNRFWQRKEYK